MGDKKELKSIMKEDEGNIYGGSGTNEKDIVNKINAVKLKIEPNSLIEPSMVAYGGPSLTHLSFPKNLTNIKCLPKKSDDKKDMTNSLIPDPSNTTGMDSK